MPPVRQLKVDSSTNEVLKGFWTGTSALLRYSSIPDFVIAPPKILIE